MSGPQQSFVIQEHTTPAGVHWDIMLQFNDKLWTWRLNVPPEQITSSAVIAAEQISDHPLKFLSYQGLVQNQTGSVQIVERGRYTLENHTDTGLELFIEGEILKGHYQLTRQSGHHWQLSPLPK